MEAIDGAYLRRIAEEHDRMVEDLTKGGGKPALIRLDGRKAPEELARCMLEELEGLSAEKLANVHEIAFKMAQLELAEGSISAGVNGPVSPSDGSEPWFQTSGKRKKVSAGGAGRGGAGGDAGGDEAVRIVRLQKELLALQAARIRDLRYQVDSLEVDIELAQGEVLEKDNVLRGVVDELDILTGTITSSLP